MDRNLLIEKAYEGMKNAYSPYSGFQVGAAILTDSGKIYTGCNVENASFSLTVCAERNAVFQAIAAGEEFLRTMAVVGGADDDEALTKPCIPCGACLQVLAEFCPPDFPILLADGVHMLCEFLPKRFGSFDAEEEN